MSNAAARIVALRGCCKSIIFMLLMFIILGGTFFLNKNGVFVVSWKLFYTIWIPLFSLSIFRILVSLIKIASY